MINNASFTTYRTTTSGSARIYSPTATITNGDGFLEPLSGEQRAILGVALAVKAWQLLTEETNFQKNDKVTISGADYYVTAFESLNYGTITLSRLILFKND